MRTKKSAKLLTMVSATQAKSNARACITQTPLQSGSTKARKAGAKADVYINQLTNNMSINELFDYFTGMLGPDQRKVAADLNNSLVALDTQATRDKAGSAPVVVAALTYVVIICRFISYREAGVFGDGS
jgi:hypothetical protein